MSDQIAKTPAKTQREIDLRRCIGALREAHNFLMRELKELRHEKTPETEVSEVLDTVNQGVNSESK
jgi:hypothetical protein